VANKKKIVPCKKQDELKSIYFCAQQVGLALNCHPPPTMTNFLVTSASEIKGFIQLALPRLYDQLNHNLSFAEHRV
jgi:hypothetical protein